MQPANLSLDPMMALWSSGGSPGSANYYQPPSSGSPEQAISTSSGPNTSRSQPDANFSMTHVLFPNTQTSQANQSSSSGNNQSRNENNGGDSTEGTSGGGGDTFMGASTPGPGGVGLGSWKWTVMDGRK